MKVIFSVISLRLPLQYMSLAKKMKVAKNLSTKLFSLYVSQKGMSYAVLSRLAFCKYNGGGLMRRVMVGRVIVRGKGYAVGVRISVETWLNYFVLLSYLCCCPQRSTVTRLVLTIMVSQFQLFVQLSMHNKFCIIVWVSMIT